MSEGAVAEKPAVAPVPNTRDANKQQGRGGGQRNKGSRPNRQKANMAEHVPKEKFTGRSDDLQGYIYDVTTSKGGVAYKRTTEEIARHVGEKYNNVGSYVRTAIMTLNVPAPTRPTVPIATGDPPAIDAVEQEIFKEKIRMYVKTEAAIEAAMKSLYDLIWGQCAESLRSRLRGNDQFTTYSTTADSLSLLKSIRAEMTGLRDKQYLSHALHQIMRNFYGYSRRSIVATRTTTTNSIYWCYQPKKAERPSGHTHEPSPKYWPTPLMTRLIPLTPNIPKQSRKPRTDISQ
jgi:hypothetical protein